MRCRSICANKYSPRGALFFSIFSNKRLPTAMMRCFKNKTPRWSLACQNSVNQSSNSLTATRQSENAFSPIQHSPTLLTNANCNCKSWAEHFAARRDGPQEEAANEKRFRVALRETKTSKRRALRMRKSRIGEQASERECDETWKLLECQSKFLEFDIRRESANRQPNPYATPASSVSVADC